MTDLILKSAVKEALNGTNISADFDDALNDEVNELLEDAAQRAGVNNRKTMQPPDL
jgi:histone H3/H4